MGSSKYGLSGFAVLLATAAALSVAPVGSAEAKMKAKYYKECYAHVEQARELIPEPKADVGGTAGKLGGAAGALGKIGGFGGLGGLGKVASTAATVQQYSGYVASAAALTEKMQNDYPDPADRILAYGEQLGEDAEKVDAGALGLDAAQQCYDDAYTQLVADFEAGEIKKRNAKKQHREIQKGMIEISMVLADAQKVMDDNLENYNEALTTETTGMGLNLGSLAQAASVAQGVAGSSGLGSGIGLSDVTVQHRSAATTQAILRQGAAHRARALGNLGGVQAAGGLGSVAAASASPASFGIMNDLSMLGGMSAVGGMSGGAAAFVGSQVAAGAVYSAVGANNDAQNAASVAAPEAAIVPIEQQISPQMMASLQAAGVSSEKYMETYGQVALTTERQFEVSSKVGQKAGW